MNTTLPFDPTDWTTIIPLFERLQEMSISNDNFDDWLEEWNQLDVAVWDAYTQLKHPAYVDMTNTEAERVYQAYVQELYSTYLGLTQNLIKKVISLQPQPPSHEYKQLWRIWQNQTTLYNPESVPIQAEISRLEGRYREIMSGYRSIPGKPLAYWMQRRTELNDLMMELLKQRRLLAQVSGMPNFLTYRWRELNRLDYTIADCQSFHRVIETSVVPLVAEHKLYDTLQQDVPEIDDPETLITGVEHLLYQLDADFGDIFHKIREGYLDIGNRPNKAPAVEAWFFSRTGMPYIHVSSNNVGSVLHESGHAIHFYLSFQAQRSMWNYAGPDEFQEFAAGGMEMLSWDFYNLSDSGLFTATESKAVRRSALQSYITTLSRNVLYDVFEHWVYGEAPENVTPTDFDEKWIELKQRFMPWDDNYKSEEEMTGWQRWAWSLFRMPLSYITYSLAAVGVNQLAQLAETDRAQAIRNYKAALMLGNTQPLTELFRTAGVIFPFTPEIIAGAGQFVLDQLEKLSEISE